MIIKANNRAADILGIRREDLIMRDVRTVFIDMNFNIDMEYLKNKGSISVTDSTALVDSRRVNCSVNMVPNIIDSCICGFGIAFKETKYLHRTVNKVAGNIASYRFEDIVGESEQMLRVIASAKKIAKTRSSVLIEGESGTGKELFAQAIHNFSTRSKGPFVAINCASLPRELIESELFGYERGAFTGALKEGKTGKFELAEGGTIFLDEIGEMPIEVQAKLLRVLDNYAISRIGSRYEKKLDVRIIAATNRNLMQEAENKNFRYDLYYRLNVFRIELPALRERRNDIRVCAQYFLETLNQQSQNGVKSYSADFMEALEQYRWVGNVRELQNIVERAYFLCDDQIIMRDYLPKHIAAVTTEVATAPVLDEAIPAILNVEDVEKRNIINMLLKTDKNVLVAAKKLSMSKSTIYRKIQKYEIDISRL
jgi:transcriptional regulator with PAS, ATPase and Fis domain